MEQIALIVSISYASNIFEPSPMRSAFYTAGIRWLEVRLGLSSPHLFLAPHLSIRTYHATLTSGTHHQRNRSCSRFKEGSRLIVSVRSPRQMGRGLTFFAHSPSSAAAIPHLSHFDKNINIYEIMI